MRVLKVNFCCPNDKRPKRSRGHLTNNAFMAQQMHPKRKLMLCYLLFGKLLNGKRWRRGKCQVVCGEWKITYWWHATIFLHFLWCGLYHTSCCWNLCKVHGTFIKFISVLSTTKRFKEVLISLNIHHRWDFGFIKWKISYKY